MGVIYIMRCPLEAPAGKAGISLWLKQYPLAFDWVNNNYDSILERLLREKKIDVDRESGRGRSENLEKGYYFTTVDRKGNNQRKD